MANRKSILSTGEVYHIYNRGVDKRDIFLDDKDYYRFIHDLYEFNDSAPAQPSKLKVRGTTSDYKKRDILVEIVCYCLMPNHFHLVLKQVKDNGITQFMRKLSTGYAMYFNEKYERSGALFQGRFKDVHVGGNEYLLHLSRYIHLNPVAIKWKGDIKETTKRNIGEILDDYRFSSYLDYIGTKNFPSLISRPLLQDQLNIKDYKDFVEDYANEKEEMLFGLTLE